jgi:hypothetical protein
MSATARTLVASQGSLGHNVFSAAAAPAVANDSVDGAMPGDFWLIPGIAANAVQKLLFVDSTGSGTFTLTCEGVTTAAITYSATPATLVGNINTALNAAFGSSQLVASGATLAAIIATFSGSNVSNRPVGVITANVGSLSAATLTISNVTTGVSGGVLYVCSDNSVGAAVWNRMSAAPGTAPSVAQVVDATTGTAAASIAAITAGGSYAQADMVAVKNGMATLAKLANALLANQKAAGLAA